MPSLTTLPVSSVGGLDTETPPQLLANNPGAASFLMNYESLPEGGYSRIRGYLEVAFDGSVTDPGEIRGIHIYKNRIIIVKGGSVYIQEPGGAWNLANATNTLTGTDRVDFCVMQPDNNEVCLITDGLDGGEPIVVELTAGPAFSDTLTTPSDVSGARWCTKYQDHVVIAGMPNRPGEVFVSTRFDPTTFTGVGSWSFQVQDNVTGLKTFRGYLYVFCENSIYRVRNLEQQTNAVVEPVTTKMGCVDHFTIQEIGGDILFLAHDGLRYLGGTDKIDDVAINIETSKVSSVIADISYAQGPISSCVLAHKRQYRLFYRTLSGVRKGLIGTLMQDGKFSWSETEDMEVDFIYAVTEKSNSFSFHASTTKVFNHESGDTFNGVAFTAVYATPYFNMGDPSVRKRAHSLITYLEAEETAALEVILRLDYENITVIQPEPFDMAPVISAARYGTALYGTDIYGALRFPLERIFLEGSGKWLQLEFRDNSSSNSRYTIRGYDLNFTVGGRI